MLRAHAREHGAEYVLEPIDAASQAVEDERIPSNTALRMGRYLRRGGRTDGASSRREESAHLVAIAYE